MRLKINYVPSSCCLQLFPHLLSFIRNKMGDPCTQNRGHIKNKKPNVKLHAKSEAKTCDKQQMLCE